VKNFSVSLITRMILD